MATRTVAAFHGSHDVLLTPTTNVPNTVLGHLDARGWYDRIFASAGFTALANVTGNPAVSLPLGRSVEGWPIGVQLTGPYAGESTLLALAGDLERALPREAHRPAVVAG